MKTLFILSISIALGGLSIAQDASPEKSVVRVNATLQGYNQIQPWQKVAPANRLGLGAVIEGGRVLVTSQMVADATYLELEKADTAAKTIAEVVAVDYESNLAVLKPADADFLNDRVPLTLTDSLKPKDEVEAWQFETNGTPVSTTVEISKAEIGRYFLDSAFFLKVQATGTVQYRSGSFTLPVVKGGKLAGLLVSYSSKDQVSNILPAEIINRFMEDLADGDYAGFPNLGIQYSQTLDEQFRKFLKLEGDAGGVFVSKVVKGASAAAAGIEEGDVVLSIGGKDLDSRGNYEHEIWGKLSFSHLVRGAASTGDTLKIGILRDGEQQEIDLKLIRRAPESELIEPYMFDRGPNFAISGGLVFQELSVPLLKLFGNDWRTRAPIKLLMAHANPEEYEEAGRRKLVVLTRVIPTPVTLGYERLSMLIVTKINGKDINDIKDLVAAFEAADGAQHRIEFADYPKLIFTDAEMTSRVNGTLEQRFGIIQRIK